MDAEQAGHAVGNKVKEALGDASIDLAFLFFSSHYADQAMALARVVRQEVSPNVLIGCMGDGIIGNAEEFEGTAVVTLWAAHLPNAHVIPMHLTFSEENEEYAIQGWPAELASSLTQPTFILLADPFSTPIETVFSHIESHCPGAPAIGGVASGGSDLGENRLIMNEAVVHTGLVGVAIWGPISIRTVISQGCQPIGEPFVVTRAERNVIYELGGVPTLERLEATVKALATDSRQQAALALQVGVAFDEQHERLERGDFLIRGLLGADKNSGGIAISDVVKEGQTVQFHLRDAQAASEELHILLAKDRVDFPREVPQGALLFSCNGRGRRFFSEPHHDVRAVGERVGNIPIAGFLRQEKSARWQATISFMVIRPVWRSSPRQRISDWTTKPA